MNDIKITATFVGDGWKQTINMYEDAYKGMLETPAIKENIRRWVSRPKSMRVIEHLKLIQSDLRASKFDFIIYND